MVVSPADPRIMEILQTLIAPGGRARLSPFVETAQFEVLFGEVPDDRLHAESARGILAKHKPHIERCAEVWAEFAKGGRDFKGNDYTDSDFLECYLAYYFSTNVAKVQLVLLDLAREGLLRGQIDLLDVGVGTGTTAVALFDFLLAWGLACDLFGEPFPVTSVRFSGIDCSPGSLTIARRVLTAYVNALARRLSAVNDESEAQESRQRAAILTKVHDWANDGTSPNAWLQIDLDRDLPSLSTIPNIVVASNVLKELRPSGLGNLEELLRKLPPDGIGIVIEPGDKGSSESLMRWRRRLVHGTKGLYSLAPCGQEHGGNLPELCDGCWSARREAFHQPPLYEAFRKACAVLTPDGRPFDQFENKLLSWSYAVVGRCEPGHCNVGAVTPVSNDEVIDNPLVMRFIGSYWVKDKQTDIAPSGPDDLVSGNAQAAWREYFKACPSVLGVSRVFFTRNAGFQMPSLRYGQEFNVTGVRVKIDSRVGTYFLLPASTKTSVSAPPRVDLPATFLGSYDDASRRAIDELAYRLFGFSEMRQFQHEIIGRVLTGRNVLGIAATGGGKSECFILPAMLLPGVTVVVAPLRALMADQYDQRIKRRFGLDHLCTYINGDVPFAERQARLRRMEMGRYKLVYFTPEQLERGYVLESLQRTHAAVGIRYLAMDEAHCISQWGHDFRPSYLNILRRLQAKGQGIDPIIIALTATASPRVRDDVCDELGLNPLPAEAGGDVFVYSSNRPELNLVVRVERAIADKASDILHQLRQLLGEYKHNDRPGAALVFMPHTGGDPEDTWRYFPEKDPEHSRQGMLSAGVTPFASFVERRLGLRVSIYHGKMDNEESTTLPEADSGGAANYPLGDLRGRTRGCEQTTFIDGERSIMVATKGFGMGIDKPNVRLVLHRTPPGDLEAYAQEAGRAGRDGELATVILYCSRDATVETDDKGRQTRIPSDREIQERFLRDRYVRRSDVIVMHAFLRTIQRGVVIHGEIAGSTRKYLYFTNDEAIHFFDRCTQRPELADLNLPYEWPAFPPRQLRANESPAHTEIFDRGHAYQCKTTYLERLLAVLHRMRPDLPGVGNHLAYLESVQETGARVKNPEIRDWEAICCSNAYFGRILRSSQIAEREFRVALGADDLSSLAIRLGLPLRELSAMLSDIKTADGHFDKNGNWHSGLLDFWWVEAPKYGPAIGKDSLAEWREYAGAWTRASATAAYKRAKEHGRVRGKTDAMGNLRYEPAPNIDDWFYWNEVNKSVGWEVQPGAAFELDNFPAYLDALMRMHDQREQDDWAAYDRLLTDYVGLDAESETSGVSEKAGRCLRAVLLGYLKSYEVVVGSDCGSCSRCRPKGDFELDMEKRRAVVVPVGPAAEEAMLEIEANATSLPSVELMTRLLGAVREEEARGRSIIRYLEGWSGRLLQDTPDHRAALWLRVQAMKEGLFEIHSREFGRNIRRLAELAAEREDALAIWNLLAGSEAIAPDELNVHIAQATVARLAGLTAEEESAWRRVIGLSETAVSSDSTVTAEAFEALLVLYTPPSELADEAKRRGCLVHLGRLSQEAGKAFELYGTAVVGWDWDRVMVEVEGFLLTPVQRPAAAAGLLCAWVAAGGSGSEGPRNARVAEYLAGAGWPLVEAASALDTGLYVSHLGTMAVTPYPKLARRWAELLFATAPTAKSHAGAITELVLVALVSEEHLEVPLRRRVREAIFSATPDQSVLRLLGRLSVNETQMHGLLAAVAGTASARELAIDIGKLANAVSDADVPVVWRLLRAAHELVTEPEVYQAQAALSQRLGRHEDEEQALSRLTELSTAQSSPVDHKTLVSAYRRLLEIYAEDGPLPDTARGVECHLGLARLSLDPDSAFQRYALIIGDWEWVKVVDEVDRSLAKSQAPGAVACGLLCAWALAERDGSSERKRKVVDYLGSVDDRVCSSASVPVVQCYCDRLGTDAFDAASTLCIRFANVLHEARLRREDADIVVRLLLSAAAGGASLSLHHTAGLRQILFAQGAADGAVGLLRRFAKNGRIKAVIAELSRGDEPASFIQSICRLVDTASDANAPACWDILLASREAVDPNTLAIIEAQARLARRLSRYGDAAVAYWEMVDLAESKIAGARSKDLVREYYENKLASALDQLRNLYSPQGPLPDQRKLAECIRRIVSSTPDRTPTPNLYAQLVAGWEWGQVLMELDRWPVRRQPAIAAALFCGWVSVATVDQRQEHSERVLSYLEGDGSSLVAGSTLTEVRTYLTWLGASALVAHPKISAQVTMMLNQADDATDIRVRLALAALAGNERLTQATLAEVVQALTADLSAAAAEDILASYASDDSEDRITPILAPLSTGFSPTTPSAMKRWLELFPPAAHLTAGVDAALRLLRVVGESRGLHPEAKLLDFVPTEAYVDDLEAIADLLFSDAELRADTHKYWLAVCRGRSALYLKHLERCLTVQPPEPDWAQEAFERVIAVGSAAYLANFFRRVSNDASLCIRLPERIQLAARYYQLIKRAVRSSGQAALDLSGSNLHALWKAMAVGSDVNNADMYVATIKAIRERVGGKPQYADLVMEGRGLCAARRYQEAQAIARLPEVFNGGREGADLMSEIAHKRQTPERLSGESDSYYQLIFKACV